MNLYKTNKNMLFKYLIVIFFAFLFPLNKNSGAYGWTSIAPQYWDPSKINDVGLFLRKYRNYNESNGGVGRDSCVSVSNGWNMGWEFWGEEDSRNFVTELLQRGVTIVRFHDLDRRLGKFDSDGKYIVDYDARDKFLYFVGLLSAHGIRWTVEVLTNSDIGKKWPKIGSTKEEKERIKFSVLYSIHSKNIWLDVLDKIFGGVNKYSGIKILSDPFLVAITPVNEGSLGFSRYQGFGMGISDELLNLFLDYLRSDEYFSENEINILYENNKSINFWSDKGNISEKFRKFVAGLEYSSWLWFRDRLLERGFSGNVLAFPEWHGATNGFVRSKIPVVDLHAYVGELWTYDLNSRWKMPSLFDGGLDDLLINLSNRWIGSKSVITEYGQPYWGASRREIGIFLPFIAARQDFGFICRHSHLPFEKIIGGNVKLMPYASGLDPVAITSGVFEYVLFSSGVVSVDNNIEILEFNENELFEKNSAFIEKKYRKLVIDRGLRLSSGHLNNENYYLNKNKEDFLKLDLNGGDRSISIAGKSFSFFSAQKIDYGKSIKLSASIFDFEISFLNNENNASAGVIYFCEGKESDCQLLVILSGDARDSGLIVDGDVVKSWGNGKIEAKKIDTSININFKLKQNSICIKYADLYGRTKLKNEVYLSGNNKTKFFVSNINNGDLYPFLLINLGNCD